MAFQEVVVDQTNGVFLSENVFAFLHDKKVAVAVILNEMTARIRKGSTTL